MQKKILFIGHDANFAGAQYLLLHLLSYLKRVDGITTMLLLGAGGKLEADFKEVTDVIFWEENEDNKLENGYLSKIVRASRLEPFLTNTKNKETTQNKIEDFNPDFVFSNTIANGDLLIKLSYLKKPFFIYCHEMEKSIKTYTTHDNLDYQLKNAKYILTGSKAVKQNLIDSHQVSDQKIGVFNSYINCKTMEMAYQAVDKQEVIEKLKLGDKPIIIGGCGLTEWRKGIDIFIFTALQAVKLTDKNIHFVWVGIQKKSTEYYHLKFDLDRMGIADRVHFIEGAVDNIKYTACFDLFFMSSREDPYPLVMIEAGLNKIPVICFEKSGGAVDFVGEIEELKIPYLDSIKAAKKIVELIDNQEKRKKLGELFYQKAWEHDISVRGPQILNKIFELK